MNNAQAKQKQNGGCKHVKIERSIKSIFNGFILKMLLRSLPVYILKQLFFSISVNSGRIFTSPLRGSVNILPLFTSISKGAAWIVLQCVFLPTINLALQSFYRR